MVEAEPAEEKPWWDDPRMPWRGRPGRHDVACWVAFSLSGLYALAMLPLRPVLLGASPLLLAALTGSHTAVVSLGALASTGRGWWPVGLLVGTLGVLKFDWLYFWAGKLWGRGLVEVIAGRSPRSRRRAERAERVARKIGPLAVLATYVLPLPSAVVYASVAAAGMRWRTFLTFDALAAVLTQGCYLYLGYRIGQPAVEVVKVIAKYSWYLSLAILAGMVVAAVWRGRRGGGETTVLSSPEPDPAEGSAPQARPRTPA